MPAAAYGNSDPRNAVAQLRNFIKMLDEMVENFKMYVQESSNMVEVLKKRPWLRT